MTNPDTLLNREPEAHRVRKLSALAARFAQEYLVDLNGTQAYLRTRPKVNPDTAASNASRLLRDAKVRREIENEIAARARRTTVSSDDVVARLWALATADVRDLVGVHVLPCDRCWRKDGTERAGAGENARPNPCCRACGGAGIATPILKDLNTAPTAAAALLVGTRVTSGAVEYRFADRVSALMLLARHFGLLGGDKAASKQQVCPKCRTRF